MAFVFTALIWHFQYRTIQRAGGLCGSLRLLLKWKRENKAGFEGSDVLGVSSAPGTQGSQPQL